MRIALVQQQPTSDLAHNLWRGLATCGVDLVVYPELAFTPFYPQHRAGPDVRALAEPIPELTTEAFQEAARRLGVVPVLNLYEPEDARAYDTSSVIDVDGTLLGKTRMMHITDYAGFHKKATTHWTIPGRQSYDPPPDVWASPSATTIIILQYLRTLALGGADLMVVPQAGAAGERPDGLFEAELRVAPFKTATSWRSPTASGRRTCFCSQANRSSPIRSDASWARHRRATKPSCTLTST